MYLPNMQNLEDNPINIPTKFGSNSIGPVISEKIKM